MTKSTVTQARRDWRRCANTMHEVCGRSGSR
jgi:hypothetical protein